MEVPLWNVWLYVGKHALCGQAGLQEEVRNHGPALPQLTNKANHSDRQWKFALTMPPPRPPCVSELTSTVYQSKHNSDTKSNKCKNIKKNKKHTISCLPKNTYSAYRCLCVPVCSLNEVMLFMALFHYRARDCWTKHHSSRDRKPPFKLSVGGGIRDIEVTLGWLLGTESLSPNCWRHHIFQTLDFQASNWIWALKASSLSNSFHSTR